MGFKGEYIARTCIPDVEIAIFFVFCSSVNGGRLLYVLASSEQKGRTPVSKPVKEENKTSRLKVSTFPSFSMSRAM